MLYIGTKACEKLYDVICNARLLDDVKKLSQHQQTSSLESYHSVINHFAPKLLLFHMWGCIAGIYEYNRHFGYAYTHVSIPCQVT